MSYFWNVAPNFWARRFEMDARVIAIGKLVQHATFALGLHAVPAVQRIALGSSSRFDEEPQRAQPPGMSPESTSNITLFDDVPSMPSADTLPTGEPEGGVPARPPDLAASPKTSQSAVLEKPLGDNIELF